MIEEKQTGRGKLFALVTMADTNDREDRKSFMAYAKADAAAWDRQIIFCPDMKGTSLSFKLACDKIERLAHSLKIEAYELSPAPAETSLGVFAKSIGAAHILIEIPPHERKRLGFFDLDFLWESYIWKMVKTTDIDVTIIDKGALFGGYGEIVAPIDSENNVHKLIKVVTIAKRFNSKVFLFTENPSLDYAKTTTVGALNNALTKLDSHQISRHVVTAKNKNKFSLQLLDYTIREQKKHVIVEVAPGKLPMQFLKNMKHFFNGENPHLAITLVKYRKKEEYHI
jgi:hypothetical protein